MDHKGLNLKFLLHNLMRQVLRLIMKILCFYQHLLFLTLPQFCVLHFTFFLVYRHFVFSVQSKLYLYFHFSCRTSFLIWASLATRLFSCLFTFNSWTGLISIFWKIVAHIIIFIISMEQLKLNVDLMNNMNVPNLTIEI